MPSELLQIAASGVRAARAGLEVTAQNIANAGTEGYVRRSVRLSELAMSGGIGRTGDISFSGVWIDGVARNADLFRQSEVRRTGADQARASTELAGLENIEAAVEQSGLYPALTAFEASLARLVADPVDPAMRAAVLESARTLSTTFNIAARGLADTGTGLRFEASDGVAQVNLLAGELGRVNLQLSRTATGSSDQTVLLDQRDSLLGKISQFADVTTTFAPDRTAEVRLGGSGGAMLVQGGTVSSLAMTTAGDGTVSYTLGGSPVAPGAGSLAGQAQALIAVRDNSAALDALADNLMASVNAVQTGGAALDGSAGVALFSGTGAAGIALNLIAPGQLATAPAGAGAGSRDPANLNSLLNALGTSDIAGQADGLLFAISSRVAGSRITAEALDAIAGLAQLALDSQAGVDLDQEAVNLVRFQQAFQASGKAIQVAANVIDTILALR
jgi:flagellar hook-associated protein 1 FlgK